MKRTLVTPCLVAVGLVVVVLLAAGVNPGTLLVSVGVLACPLMMLLMMGGMFGMARHRSAKQVSDVSTEEDAATRGLVSQASRARNRADEGGGGDDHLDHYP